MVDAAQKLQKIALSPHSPVSAECPDCGKYCIVELEPYKYQCLSCNFSRDFTQDKPASDLDNQQSTNGPGLLLTILIAVLVTIALL